MPRGENLRGRRLPTAGRKPGSENKLTRNLREAVEAAFTELGGKDWLVKVARSDPAVFVHLLGKLLPKAVEISGDLNMQVVDFRAKLEAARKRLLERMKPEETRPECQATALEPGVYGPRP